MPERVWEFEEELRKLTQDALADTVRGGRAPDPVVRQLTAREREVLMLIASGKSTKEVASILGMALPTAVTHRYHLQQKLKARNTAELTRAAVRLGLISF